jgi:hypothetical protein
MTPPDAPELVTALARIEELLERIAAALERIEAQGERTNELLLSLDRSQYS